MDETLTFGTWLKRRRKTLDLTQGGLAVRLGCAIGTVRRLESDDLRPSRQVAARLAEVLRIPAEARDAFVAFARDLPQDHDFSLAPELPDATSGLRTEPPRAPSLPRPPTPLIGRAHIIAAAATVLLRSDVRLLTLIGPPGVGKTRVAIQVATEIEGQFTDGAIFVPLAPVGDPGMVGIALADALNVRGSGGVLPALVERLADRDLLLVIDNMEHVVAASPLLAHLLSTSTRLRLLVTSRVPLRLSGEHELVVPPLALPDLKSVVVESLAENPAVALFCARAYAVRPGFTLDEGNAAAVGAICQKLDGLPLAIELAAMRVKVFSPQALHDRLEQRLPLLSGGARDAPARHQTVQAAIAWSYDLLPPAEQQLLAAASVFAGGWSIETVEALARGADRDLAVTPGSPVDMLTALVDQSLVQADAGPDGEPRFTMLEVVREYAQARLASNGLAEPLRARHARIFLELAEQAGIGLQQADQPRWFARLDQEIDNLRSALDWSMSEAGDPTVGIGIASALWWFWWASGRIGEGRRWFAALLPRVDPSGPVYARGLMGAGFLAFWAGDFGASLPYADAAIAEGERSGQTTVVAYAKLLRGAIMTLTAEPGSSQIVAECAALLEPLGDAGAWYLGTTRIVQTISASIQGDLDTAEHYGHASLAIFRRIGQPYGIASALNYLGDIARLRGNRDQAAEYYTSSLALMRESRVRSDEPALLHNLAYIALAANELTRARALFLDSLQMHRDMSNRIGVAECCFGLASVAAVAGDPSAAARLVGFAAAVESSTDMPAWAAERAERAHYLQLAREALSPVDWAAAVAIGRTLTLDQVIAQVAVLQ